MKLSHK